MNYPPQQSFPQNPPPPFSQPLPGAPYPPPYMPPQPPSAHKPRRRLMIVLGSVVGALLLCVVSLVLIISFDPAASQTPTATKQPTHALTQQPTKNSTAIATATPKTKPTAAPSGLIATHGIPHLGGPLSDFVGAYGQPNGHSSPPLYHFMTVGDNIDEYLVDGIGWSCPSVQCMSEQLVDDITVQSPDQNAGFTPSEAEARCMSYAPSDAHFKQKFVYADNSGYDMVYFSASLARAFPASLDSVEFSDGNGGTVTPGTFDVSYLYADNGQGIGSCDIITGEQQTQQ